MIEILSADGSACKQIETSKTEEVSGGNSINYFPD